MDAASWQQVVSAAQVSGETVSEYLRRVVLKDAKRTLRREQ